MSNIGIAANLFQPSGKCLKCRHWNPATKDFMGNGTDGHCRLAYCKNSRLTMCLLGMWCFYYIGVVMAEMR